MWKAAFKKFEVQIVNPLTSGANELRRLPKNLAKAPLSNVKIYLDENWVIKFYYNYQRVAKIKSKLYNPINGRWSINYNYMSKIHPTQVRYDVSSEHWQVVVSWYEFFSYKYIISVKINLLHWCLSQVRYITKVSSVPKKM